MLGIDIVKISRLKNLESKFGLRGLKRFLSDEEVALCLKHKDSVKSYNFSRIAGFFAAKEALSKALGCGISKELGFLDMHIHIDSKGAPHITLSDRANAHFSAKIVFSHIALSITHESKYAVACVALR
ncbi:holo-ACP synthase [Helicobacter sp. 23-1046]